MKRALAEAHAEEPRDDNSLRVAYLFSGVADNQDGFALAAKEFGKEIGIQLVVDHFDVLNGEEQDLSIQHIFEGVSGNIDPGYFHAALSSPPCPLVHLQDEAAHHPRGIRTGPAATKERSPTRRTRRRCGSAPCLRRGLRR